MSSSCSTWLHGGARSSTTNMRLLLALLPGLGVSIWFLGYGVIFNLVLANVCALALEAVALTVRGKHLPTHLGDNSCVLSATLLALALPVASPWWLIFAATAFAVLIARHAFGGHGQAPFNPAMAGLLFVMLAWPEQLQYTWPVGNMLSLEALQQSVSTTLFGTTASADGMSMATPLLQTGSGQSLQLLQAWQQQEPVWQAGTAGEWINLAFLCGGMGLLVTRTLRSSIPMAMLGSMAVIAWLFAGTDAILPQLLSGGTMLAAFFIATDFPSAAITRRGRLLYGAIAGCAIVAIRFWGQYPDGIAAAIIFANFCAPLLDLIGKPRIIGHQVSHRPEGSS